MLKLNINFINFDDLFEGSLVRLSVVVALEVYLSNKRGLPVLHCTTLSLL